MATILTAHQRKSLSLGFAGGAAAPSELYNLLVRQVPNLSNREQHFIVGDTDAPYPERGAEAMSFSSIGGWQYEVDGTNWPVGLKLTHTDLVGDTFGVLKSKGAETGGNYPLQYEDHLITNLIVEGDATTYGGAWTDTSVAFFSGTGAGHSYPGEAEYKTAMLNLLQAAEVSTLNVATTTKPTVAEWQALAYDVAAYITTNAKTDRGKRLFQGGEMYHLIVPLGMRETADKAFGADLVGAGDTNMTKGKWQVHSHAALSDTSIFYVYVERPGMDKPFVHPWWQMSNGSRYLMAATDENSDSWVKDKELLISFDSWEDIAYGDFRSMYRCVLS